MVFVLLNKNVTTRQTAVRRYKGQESLFVLCFHLRHKGLPTAVSKKQVDRHSTFKNQTVDPPMFFSTVTLSIVRLKKQDSHPSDITFRTTILPSTRKEVLHIRFLQGKTGCISNTKGEAAVLWVSSGNVEAPGKNLFLLDADMIGLIREINVFPRQLCWCNHWSGQTSAAFKIQLIPLFPEVQDSPRIIVRITDVCDAALQCYKYR